MRYIISIIIAIAGALIGSVSGGLFAGYLVIFKSLAHIASIAEATQWTRLFEGGIILLFIKPLVIVGFIAGGFFGSIPGIIGMAKYDENH